MVGYPRPPGFVPAPCVALGGSGASWHRWSFPSGPGSPPWGSSLAGGPSLSLLEIMVRNRGVGRPSFPALPPGWPRSTLLALAVGGGATLLLLRAIPGSALSGLPAGVGSWWQGLGWCWPSASSPAGPYLERGRSSTLTLPWSGAGGGCQWPSGPPPDGGSVVDAAAGPRGPLGWNVSPRPGGPSPTSARRGSAAGEADGH